MRNKQKILVDQLNEKIKVYADARNILAPPQGWINAIRTTFNMTMEQLGNRLGITKQGVKRLEENEANGSVTLNSLKEIANALDMQLVYALVPKTGSVDDLITTKARELARKIVLRTNQTMKLEDQGIGDEKLNETIEELAGEIKREMRRSLWD